MINNPINATKGKHTFHLPLGDFYRKLSVEIWMENCANLNVCGLECVSVCAGISLVAVSCWRHWDTWVRLLISHILQTWGAKIYSSNCGAITVVNGSRFVFNITPIDVNSIPPSSWGHSESLCSTAPSAYQKRTNNWTAKICTSELTHSDHYPWSSLFLHLFTVALCHLYDGPLRLFVAAVVIVHTAIKSWILNVWSGRSE